MENNTIDVYKNRSDYYFVLEKALKASMNCPCYIQFENEDTHEWNTIHYVSGDLKANNLSHYRIVYVLSESSFNPFIIDEHSFDKYYLPMIDYSSKEAVEYRTNDIGITINNLQYIIMSQLKDYIFKKSGDINEKSNNTNN